MDLDQILSQILYAMSGFLFGIFASRYSVLSWFRLKQQGFKAAIFSVPFLIVSFIVFPLLLASRTTVGGFVYCAVLIYFFSIGCKRR